jgi:hypothetical protein
MRLASPLEMLGTAFTITSLLGLCTALPATPTSSPIPMPVKYQAFRNYISTLPDTNATHNYALGAAGPTFQQTYADGDCLEVRYYNRDCIRNILYKTRGVLNFLDTLWWSYTDAPWPGDAYTYFQTGYYEDPDDGWDFYYTPYITFGKCGNKGYLDLCSVTWCKDKNGNSGLTDPNFYVPKGANAILDPNDKDSLCPWLKEGGSKC